MKKSNTERQAAFRKNLAASGRKKISLVLSIETDGKLAELASETGYTRNQLVEQMIEGAHMHQTVRASAFLNPESEEQPGVCLTKFCS